MQGSLDSLGWWIRRRWFAGRAPCWRRLPSGRPTWRSNAPRVRSVSSARTLEAQPRSPWPSAATAGVARRHERDNAAPARVIRRRARASRQRRTVANSATTVVSQLGYPAPAAAHLGGRGTCRGPTVLDKRPTGRQAARSLSFPSSRGAAAGSCHQGVDEREVPQPLAGRPRALTSGGRAAPSRRQAGADSVRAGRPVIPAGARGAQPPTVGVRHRRFGFGTELSASMSACRKTRRALPGTPPASLGSAASSHASTRSFTSRSSDVGPSSALNRSAMI